MPKPLTWVQNVFSIHKHNKSLRDQANNPSCSASVLTVANKINANSKSKKGPEHLGGVQRHTASNSGDRNQPLFMEGLRVNKSSHWRKRERANFHKYFFTCLPHCCVGPPNLQNKFSGVQGKDKSAIVTSLFFLQLECPVIRVHLMGSLNLSHSILMVPIARRA